MKGHASKNEVRDFLTAAKEVITNPVVGSWSWVLVRRQKNLDCISDLGFNLADVRATILGLSVKDYCEGPVDDKDEPGELWVFGKMLENREVYIKLKIASLSILKVVRIVSFHEGEKPICYPYGE